MSSVSTGLLQEIMNTFVSRSGTYNPQFPLFGYITAGIPVVPYYAAVGGLRSTRLHDLPVALMIAYLARATTILMAAGTVVVACRTALVLWGASGAWIAGLLTMLYPPMFYYGRTVNVDVPALFWTALALWQFAIVLQGGFKQPNRVDSGRHCCSGDRHERCQLWRIAPGWVWSSWGGNGHSTGD